METEMVSGASVLYSTDVGMVIASVESSSAVTAPLAASSDASTRSSHSPSTSSFDCIE